MAESQNLQYHQLYVLERMFEESAANEEKQLLEKVAEMLASSRARKKEVVQAAVNNLCMSAADRASNLQTEISTAREFTSSVRKEWAVYMEGIESRYLEDTDAVETGIHSLEEGIQQCMAKTISGSEQWKTARDFLLDLGQINVASIDSIVRAGIKSHQILHNRHFSAATASLIDVHGASQDLISSIICSLKLDEDVRGNIDSVIVFCHGELKDMKSGHYHTIAEISDNADKCLELESSCWSI